MRYDTRDMTAARALRERAERHEATEDEEVIPYPASVIYALGH
jgi:hypothetical protein